MNKTLQILLWPALAILGAFSFAAIALNRGESVSAAWLVTAALCVFFIAYRFYSKFIAEKVLQLDDSRMTPAVRHHDGVDFVPTNKHVLYGHHFAAIAGAGPLVGPVLAAQWGYLPGTIWLLAGVVFAGAVQDFVVLFCSIRRDGRSLGEMVKMEMGPAAGAIALVGTLAIMIIILAALGLIVVKALGESPWGTFTVAVTIPLAMAMGIYMRYIRPGKILEASAFGVVVLLLTIWYGQYVSHSPTLGPLLTYSRAAARMGGDRVRRDRLHATGVAAARAARLPVYLPEDRRPGGARHRHLHRAAGTEDACDDAFHRRHGAGGVGLAVPVPVHHHRLRFRVGLPRPDLLRHDAEDDRARGPGPLHRLRRHADRVLRRRHGARRRVRARPGHLLRNERAGSGDRADRRYGRQGHQRMGLDHHARAHQPDREGSRRAHHPASRGRRANAGGRHRADYGAGVRRQGDGSAVVPLRDPVRGAFHPHRGRRGHACRALHDPGSAWPRVRAARPHRTRSPPTSSPPSCACSDGATSCTRARSIPWAA